MTNKKELLSLLGTKALNFCGTTQINDCLAIDHSFYTQTCVPH